MRKIEDNFVETDDGKKYYFKSLVGADGSNSIVRKSLGLKNKKIAAAFHYVCPRKDNEKIDLTIRFSAKDFGPFYGWIFPHKEFLSIGTGGTDNQVNLRQVKKNLERWIDEMGIDRKVATYEAFPINCDYQGCVFGNKYLIGDAAGLASFLTGEGIYQAIVSGEEIAKKIVNNKYDMPEIKKMQKFLNTHAKITGEIKKRRFLRPFIFWSFCLMSRNRRFAQKVIDTTC